MNSRYLQFLGLVGALAGAQLGCGDSTEDVVKGRAVGLDRMTQHAGVGPGALASIHGTYGTDCVNRTGTWTALVGGGSVDDPLTVRTSDPDCQLTLTSVTMTGDPLDASTAIPLAETYATIAPSFSANGTLLFYANAVLSPADFAHDFDITVVYSDSEDAVELDNTGHPVTVHPITVTAENVPAPAYALDVEGVFVGIDTVSSMPVIVNVTGPGAFLSVTPGAQTGENYVIVDTLADHTYDTINAAYTGVTPVPISVNPAPIPPASFLLVRDPEIKIPQDRFLIVAHTEIDSHVTSYQVFTIHFLGGSECGNALIEAGEECDDGNLLDTDTCSSTCQDIP